MSAIYNFLLGWMPAQIANVVFGLIAFVIVLIIFRVIKLILDALPFL